MTALRDAALEYCAKGFHVIPCHPREKVPLIQWKNFQTLETPKEFIEEWWEKYPDANVALVLGQGLFAVDVDGPLGHKELQAHGIRIPACTPTSLTGKGVHYIFQGEAVDRVGLLPQVDIRGRGIIVAPPSIHPSGKQYTWLVPPDTIPEAPEALLRLLSQPSHTQVAPNGPSWLAEALAGVGEGVRNATCAKLAGYFLGKGMPQEAVEQLLLTWADKCSPRMSTDEVMRCVKSIAGREGPHDDEPKSLEDGLLTVSDLYEQIPEQHTWILKDYIPKGALVMLASEEKVGKSTFAYAMISAIVHMQRFLDRPVTKVPVLMLAAEEHPTDVKIRCQMFDIRPGDPVTYYVGDLPNDDMTLHDLTSIVKTRGIGLVVLDTMGHYISEALESENDSMGAIKALKPWLRLARATNAAVLVIHHTGKSGAAYRGSSGFGGIVDQILTLRHAGGRQRSLESRGRYWNTPRNLLISLENNDYRVLS
jgi:hypothetical protein